jgi:hypothetical protein
MKQQLTIGYTYQCETIDSLLSVAAEKSNDIRCSFSAACQILTIDEALLGLTYDLNFNVVERFINVSSKCVNRIILTARES